MSGWIGVDLDGTLAHYEGWNGGQIGEPVPAMLERVKRWLAEGKEVRIVTARVAVLQTVGEACVLPREVTEQVSLIGDWCERHIGQRLPVTAMKDFAMVELWDDRCKQVWINRGVSVEEEFYRTTKELEKADATISQLRKQLEASV